MRRHFCCEKAVELPEDALDKIDRIQTRQRLNEEVKTSVPGIHSARYMNMKAKPKLVQSMLVEQIRADLNAHW